MTRPRQKPLRKIVEYSAKEMRDGFKKVNERLDDLKNRMDNLENEFHKTNAKLDTVIKLNNLKY